MQHVADPQLVAPVGLEPPGHRRFRRHVPVELQVLEMALQGPFRWRPPGLGTQDPHHLSGGALRRFSRLSPTAMARTSAGVRVPPGPGSAPVPNRSAAVNGHSSTNTARPTSDSDNVGTMKAGGAGQDELTSAVVTIRRDRRGTRSAPSPSGLPRAVHDDHPGTPRRVHAGAAARTAERR